MSPHLQVPVLPSLTPLLIYCNSFPSLPPAVAPAGPSEAFHGRCARMVLGRNTLKGKFPARVPEVCERTKAGVFVPRRRRGYDKVRGQQERDRDGARSLHRLVVHEQSNVRRSRLQSPPFFATILCTALAVYSRWREGGCC